MKRKTWLKFQNFKFLMYSPASRIKIIKAYYNLSISEMINNIHRAACILEVD